MIKKIHQEIHRQFDEEIQDIKEKRWKDVLFERPLFKFVIFLIAQLLFSLISGYFPESLILRWISVVINIGITVYFISMIIYVIRRSINTLMRPKNILTLIGSYALIILSLLFVFSTLFDFSELVGIGYLKHGTCPENFHKSMIVSDPDISQDFFYYTALSFFSRSSDICPMGASKIISVIVYFTSHLFSVILIALILNNYFSLRRESK